MAGPKNLNKGENASFYFSGTHLHLLDLSYQYIKTHNYLTHDISRDHLQT
jgi:hypothetical protein